MKGNGVVGDIFEATACAKHACLDHLLGEERHIGLGACDRTLITGCHHDNVPHRRLRPRSADRAVEEMNARSGQC